MKHMIALTAAFAIVLGAIEAAKAQSADLPGQGHAIIAVVNGEEIDAFDMKMLVETLPPEYRNQPVEYLYAQLINHLVDRKLLVQAARDAGLRGDEDVARRIAFMEDGVLEETYFTRLINEELTEERLRAAYDDMIADWPVEDEVRARHILLETEEQAKSAVAELEAGADFAELAKEKSIGPSGAVGGDLDFFTRDGMVSEFSEAAFALEPGEFTSEPVQTQHGWHVIKSEERREAQPPSYEESLNDLIAQTAPLLIDEITAALRATAKIEMFDLDGNRTDEPE